MHMEHTVFKDGTSYLVKDKYEKIKHRSENPRESIQWALGNLTSRRNYKEIVTIDIPDGLTDIDNTIHVNQYTTLKSNAHLRLKDGLTCPDSDPNQGWTLLDTPGRHDIDIIGGIYDGNEISYRNRTECFFPDKGRLQYPWNSHGILIGSTHDNTSRSIKNIMVKGVQIENTLRSNIVIEGDPKEKNNINIYDSKMKNSLGDHLIYLASGNGILVRNCEFSGFCASSAIVFGTDEWKIKNVTMEKSIVHNLVPNPGGFGFDWLVNIRPDLASNITISDNIFELGGLYKIGLRVSSSNIKVLGNKFIGNLLDNERPIIEIRRSNVEITGNYIDSIARGIDISNDSENVNNITVKNNQILVNNLTLRIKADKYLIENIIVNNNILYAKEGQWIRESIENNGTLKNVTYSNNVIYSKDDGVIIVGKEDNNYYISKLVFAVWNILLNKNNESDK